MAALKTTARAMSSFKIPILFSIVRTAGTIWPSTIAGLQINCVNCGESLLVPIPDGMKINDLDLEPGEILKQLFATRRNLQKTELRAAMLEERLAEQTGYRESVEARLAALRMQVEEMRQYCLQQQTANGKLLALIDVLAGASDESGAAPAEPA